MRKKKFYSKLSAVLAMVMILTALPLNASAASNPNHVLKATMSASSVEENSSALTAAKAGDGDDSTRWSSDSLTSSEEGADEWLKATFTEVTEIKHIKVKFHTRNINPEPANVSSFSIKYTDANGDLQVAKENCTVAASGDGYATDVSIVLDEPIMAKEIQLCDFAVLIGTTQWNSVGVVELEAYSEELDESAVNSVADLVAQLEAITGATVEADVTKFELPEAPEGYTIELNGADFEQIIGDDLTVVHPLTDKEVQVSYKVSDGTTTAITDDITYIVKGIYTQEEGKNAKPTVIPEIQEWYSGDTRKVPVADLTKVIYNDASLEEIVDEFIADYEDFTGIKLGKECVDGFTASAFVFRKEAPDALLGEEGYRMEISADTSCILVESESVTGNMYAMQTILQMYKQDSEGFADGIMRDYPRFEVRGLLLDIARKPIAMNMINDIARTMRYYKMNDFQLHLSDNYIFLENYGHGDTEKEAFDAYEAYRLECDVTNEAGESPTATDYSISKDEMRTFIQSQRALGMNIVPEIDMPAHATSFTKIWPELMVTNAVSPLNTSRPLVDHFDVSNQAAIDKILEIFDDYTTGDNPTFDAETTVHIGADEFVYNYTAYRNFVNQLVPHVKETNTVRMWGGLTWIDDGKTEIVTEAIEDVEMNLWSRDWADGLQMYNMGYKLINTIDDYGYMVPSGSLTRANSYGDLLNVSRVFSSFAANSVRTSSGYVELPSGDDQILGAAFAIWSDNIDKSASGLTESDLYWRFFDALPFYAEKTWAATGQEKGTADALAALAEEMGTGPNTNPYYQEDKVGETYENYDFENGLKDASENGRDLTAGTATVADGVLTLSGDNSYVTSPIDKIGNGNELSFDITLTEIPEPGDIIFETTPEYGTHDIRIMEDGKLGFTRELYNYYFDYELPVGKTVNIKIVAQQQETTLYVDGELIGAATGKFIHNDIEKKTGIAYSTFAIPLERIGSETNAIAAVIDNVTVKEAEEPVDLYNKAGWSGTTNSETVYSDTEGLLKYAFDDNAGTIWHSNWQGATDKLTGSNSFYAEIDFGQAYTINQFSFTPRTPQASGRVTKADLYIKANADDEWILAAEDATFANDDTTKTFNFEEQDVRYVKFVAKESNDGWVAVSEFDIANKPQQLCTVYVEAEEGGSVSGATEAVAGTEVTVSAAIDDGYTFDGWYDNLGNKVSEDTEYTFTVEKNTALVARFIATESESDEVIRIAGVDRYGTAYKAADTLKKELGVEKFDAVVVATGKNFADALSGSYLAVVKNAPILLTNGKTANVAELHDYIRANLKENGTIYILGGEDAVPKNVAAITGYNVERLAGNTRYETNLAILEEAGITGTELIVATGKEFADSLSASATKRPILLVKPNASLTGAQKAVVEKVSGGKIYIVGGESAVSTAYEKELTAYAEVERVAGANRQETSKKVAETFFADADSVVVASAKNYPDGLCGGPLAAAMNVPLLLTTDGKTTVAEEYVAAKDLGSGYVLGGVAALSDESVEAIFGVTAMMTATKFNFELAEGEEQYVENMIFEEDVTVSGDNAQISFVNCKFYGDIINKADEFTRVGLFGGTIKGNCILENSIKETTLEASFPKFITDMPVNAICEECIGSVVVLGDFEVKFNGTAYSIGSCDLFYDASAGIVEYEGQKVSCYSVIQWWENGEHQLVVLGE